MPLLQVRDFPEPLYKALELRAKEERRSISQQTIVMLSKELGVEASNRERRRKILADIDEMHANNPEAFKNLSDPVALIREDRER